MLTATTLFLLLSSCTGGNPFDTETDTGSDTDADSDADVTFDIVIPMSGATVTVDDEDVPCDASNVCAATVNGDGPHDVIVEHDAYYFIPKQVTVTNGVPDASQVTYATGGCASDPDWTGTSWCDDWVMSEYQVTVEGEYCDEQDRCVDVETGHEDLDGDGGEESVMDMDGWSHFNASGNLMYGFNGETVFSYGNISSDLSVLTYWYDVGAADLARKIFTRQ